jgi:hypothetical protein
MLRLTRVFLVVARHQRTTHAPRGGTYVIPHFSYVTAELQQDKHALLRLPGPLALLHSSVSAQP